MNIFISLKKKLYSTLFLKIILQDAFFTIQFNIRTLNNIFNFFFQALRSYYDLVIVKNELNNLQHNY